MAVLVMTLTPLPVSYQPDGQITRRIRAALAADDAQQVERAGRYDRRQTPGAGRESTPAT